MRHQDWEPRLAEYLGGKRGAAFEWGSNDCVLFAAGAIEAMTGQDPAAHVRGRYRTHIGAMRKLHREGAREPADLVAARLEPVATAYAGRGDIVADRDGWLGVCAGRLAWFVGEDGGTPGLVAQPLSAWACAWRVPY